MAYSRGMDIANKETKGEDRERVDGRFFLASECTGAAPGLSVANSLRGMPEGRGTEAEAVFELFRGEERGNRREGGWRVRNRGKQLS